MKFSISAETYIPFKDLLKAHSHINCIYVDVYWSCFKIIAVVSSFKILSLLDVDTHWVEAKAWFSFPPSFYKVIRNKKWIHKPERIFTSSDWWRIGNEIDLEWLNKEFGFWLGRNSKIASLHFTHRFIYEHFFYKVFYCVKVGNIPQVVP